MAFFQPDEAYGVVTKEPSMCGDAEDPNKTRQTINYSTSHGAD